MSSSSIASPSTRTPNDASPSFLGVVWAFLSSLRLLLITLALGGIPLVVGTFFIQKPLGQFNPDQEIERLGPGLFALLETFDIYNIYHSWYFQAILLTISINNICCTIDRFFVRAQQLTSKAVGVIIIHVGVNVVLYGAFYSSRAGVEGFMQVFEGAPPKSTMFGMTSRDEIPLPFSVQLDDFRLVHWDAPDERLFLVDTETRKTLKAIKFQVDRPFPQTFLRGRSDYVTRLLHVLRWTKPERVRIDAFLPHAVPQSVPALSDDPDAPWVMELTGSTDGLSGAGYVTAGESTRVSLEPGEVSVAYVRTKTPAAFAQALEPTAVANVDEPTLVVRDRETGVTRRYAVAAGAVIQTDDDNGVVTVLEHVADFSARGTGRTRGSVARPAVRIELRDDDGTRTGWLLANMGALSVMRNDWITLSFQQGAQPGGTTHEIDFVVGPAGERRLVHRREGHVVESRPAPAGTAFALPEFGVRLEVAAYFDGAKFVMEATASENEAADAAIKVTLLSGDAPTYSGWLFAGQRGEQTETGLFLVYERDFAIKEFQSDLSIFKNGVLVQQQEIIVNRYLAQDGYHLYQASYDQQEGRWSGVSIKRDPGIPVIYTGFTFMFLGILFLFYIRPILEARSSGRRLVPEAVVDDTY